MSTENSAPWTIFLDRDGVINRRIPGSYISRWVDFEFLPGALAAIVWLSRMGLRIVVVTNQQGVALNLMTIAELEEVHRQMLAAVRSVGGRIDKVYYCPEAAANTPRCRKPNPGMAEQAQRDFPDIDFSRSIIAGDSASDMEFGQNLGMTTALIHTRKDEAARLDTLKIDFRFNSLLGFANFIFSSQKTVVI